VSPPTLVLDQLAAARRAGESFEQTWPKALKAALSDAPDDERDDWQAALDGTAERWREAFERRAPRRAEQALRVLLDPDRETAPDTHGICQHCSGPIPPGKKRHARYCGDQCRKRAYDHARAVERAAA
jgi:RNA polymerase-binding transcription factor DksA